MAEEELNVANLQDLTSILDKISKNGIDAAVIERYIDMLLTIKVSKFDNGELQHQLEAKVDMLDRYRTTLHKLNNTFGRIILEKKHEIYSGQKVKDLNQPKYKLSSCEEILEKTRQTLNNWTNTGALKCYQIEGKAKYVLESDLKAKYKEIHGKELHIDEAFRKKYEYNM